MGSSPSHAAINDGAPRFPALLEQQSQAARFFEQRSLAGHRIFRTVHPGIVMVAANDPLVGRDAAGNLRDDVVHWLDVPVEFHLQMNLRRARATWYGIGKLPRHSSGAMGPLSAASRGCASP